VKYSNATQFKQTINKGISLVLLGLACPSCNFRVGRDMSPQQSQTPSQRQPQPASQSKTQAQPQPQPQTDQQKKEELAKLIELIAELEKLIAKRDAQIKEMKELSEAKGKDLQEWLKKADEMELLSNTLKKVLCLAAETPIHVKAETGTQTKAVSKVTVEDQVLSCEFGVCEFRPIEAISTQTANDLYQLKFNGEQVIHATADHPFFEVVQDKWKPAKELVAGDVLYSVNGEKVTLESIEPLPGTYEVYNLKIADSHSYFANGILTHECGFFATIQLEAGKRVVDEARKFAAGGIVASKEATDASSEENPVAEPVAGSGI